MMSLHAIRDFTVDHTKACIWAKLLFLSSAKHTYTNSFLKYKHWSFILWAFACKLSWLQRSLRPLTQIKTWNALSKDFGAYCCSKRITILGRKSGGPARHEASQRACNRSAPVLDSWLNVSRQVTRFWITMSCVFCLSYQTSKEEVRRNPSHQS